MEYRVLGKLVDKQDVEVVIRNKRVQDALKVLRGETIDNVNRYYIAADLPVSFKAWVIREKNGRDQTVRLESGEMIIEVPRMAGGEPENGLGVSCDPDGARVPVDSININFRRIDDKYTDRGIVWVNDGNPAYMSLILEGKAIEGIGLTVEILQAAEEAVNKKVLSLFKK